MERLFSLLSLVSLLVSLFFLAGVFGAFRRLRGFLRRLLPLTLALFFLVASLLTGIIAWGLHSYRQSDREDLIAVIRCERAFQKGADFTLIYTPIASRTHETKTRVFQMKGNEWAFGGAILRWKGWLRFLGAKTLYRPLWIVGRSIDFSQPSFYSLKEGIDPLWFLLDRLGGSLPFIEATYGNSVSSPPEYGVNFNLYATPTGFAIKKVITPFRDIS